MHGSLPPILTALLLSQGAPAESVDLRTGYDVLSYRLDLTVDPARESIRGTGFTTARVVAEELGVVQLDLDDALLVTAVRELEGDPSLEVRSEGAAVSFLHEDDQLLIELTRRHERDEVFTVAVDYAGSPRAVDDFFGFHWARTPTGEPWINTSVQGIGSHHFWPCKDSFFHPEDKHERLYVNLTVPEGLYAVSNGRLTGRTPAREGWETFAWAHEYPCPTYSVTVNVAPYRVVERELRLPELPDPVPFVYYVLPESLDMARVQFAEVPDLLSVFSEAFGPWPFPAAKIGIVQTNFFGMEHSTALAYGSTFPAWRKLKGEPDRLAHRNRWFDFILVHELAHEWWGNAVTAADWGHFWLHEGFTTYAESLIVESREGRRGADEYFDRLRSQVSPQSRLFRGAGTSSEEAYGSVLYVKGAWVLNTLRHYVDDDRAWWRALREFNLRSRGKSVSTDDFRRVLEEVTDRNWARFFDEWFYGVGYPTLTGTIRVEGASIALDVENPVRYDTPFHVPVDLGWYEGERWVQRRIELGPGTNRVRFLTEAPPKKLELIGLDRVLGRHRLDLSGE